MRDGWTETTLGDAVEVLDRFRRPVSAAERENRKGPVPYYGATGQAGWIDVHIFDEDLVLLGEDAIDFLNPDVHKAYLITGPSWVNNHAHVLRARPSKVLPFFLMESLNAVDYSQFVAFGTRSKLTQGSMMGISLALPPLEEQRRIVDVVASVDAYIDALKDKVAKARTARNAVLHELLSAGGPDWTETTLGDVADVLSGFAFKSEFFSQSAGIPLIRIRDLQNRTTTEVGYMGDFDDRFLVNRGDFLIGMDGEFRCYEWLGGPALLNQRVCRIQDFKTKIVIPHFVYFLINDHLAAIEDSTSFTTVKHISTKQVKAITFLRPPLKEQRRIVDIISSMDEVIVASEKAVAEAVRLRAGLLSDLLSGEHEIPASYDSLLGAA